MPGRIATPRRTSSRTRSGDFHVENAASSSEPEDEHGIGRPALLEGIHRSRVPVELDGRSLDPREGEAGELEPRLGRSRGSLVTGIRDDEDDELRELELAQRCLRESDVAEVRRVEDAAQDSRRGYCHSSSSSPTST